VLRNTEYVDPSYKYAGGGMLSTVEDLCRFGSALFGGRLLKPETLALMERVRIDPVLEYVPGKDPRRRDFKQALIWRVGTLDGYRLIHHGGSVKGTRTQLFIFPEIDLVVALIANCPMDTLPPTRALARKILAGLRDQP
jgi:CubicO group peptidase (beta-lactamase class C family)